jgi:hypothetical protein
MSLNVIKCGPDNNGLFSKLGEYNYMGTICNGILGALPWLPQSSTLPVAPSWAAPGPHLSVSDASSAAKNAMRFIYFDDFESPRYVVDVPGKQWSEVHEVSKTTVPTAKRDRP